MATQLNVRIPDLTQSQLKELGESTGMTQTQLVIVAIDRFYQEQRRTPMRTTLTQYSAILEKYIESSDFRNGIISSTQAGFGGSGYSVELFKDGTWRSLWDNQIGNRYESEGVILSLPALDTDGRQEYIDDGAGDEEDFLKEQFEIEREEIAQQLREALREKLS